MLSAEGLKEEGQLQIFTPNDFNRRREMPSDREQRQHTVRTLSLVLSTRGTKRTRSVATSDTSDTPGPIPLTRVRLGETGGAPDLCFEQLGTRHGLAHAVLQVKVARSFEHRGGNRVSKFAKP